MSVVERGTNIPTTYDGSIAPAREALAHVVSHVLEVRPHEDGDHDQHKRDAQLPEAVGGSADILTAETKTHKTSLTLLTLHILVKFMPCK
jgi:hypothetical protein